MYRYTFFLTSIQAGDEWSASHSGRFTPGERSPSTHWIEGWVAPRAGLDDVEERKFFTLPGFELRPLGRPVRKKSLYRLRYPGSNNNCIQIVIGKLHKLTHRWTEKIEMEFRNIRCGSKSLNQLVRIGWQVPVNASVSIGRL
jgi:hypothetical protein